MDAAAAAAAEAMPSCVNLGNGQPEESRLPAELVSRAASTLLSEHGPPLRWLQYGVGRGDPEALEALAALLTEQYGFGVLPAELCLTTGVSGGLDMAAGALLRPGDTILVETPCYFLVPAIFRQRGLRTVPVRAGPRGLDPAEVDRLAAEHGAAALYSTVTHNNPRGWTLDEEARRALAAVAEARGLWLLCDEVYQMLHFESARPAAAMAQFTPRAVSVSSFSKILAPGLRVGWLHTRSAEAMRRLAADGVLCSGGPTSNFSSGVALSLMRAGTLLPYVRGLRRLYEARHAALAAALREHLPRAEFREATGGYFLWVRLPGVDAVRLLEHCSARVAFKTGALCSLGDQDAALNSDCVRLCFAHFAAPVLVEGVRRLAAAVREAFPEALQ